MASAYRYTPLGLLAVEKAVVLSKFVAAMDRSFPSWAKPNRSMHNSMASLAVATKLLSRMPHSLDILCNKHANVLTAMAIPATIPRVSSTLDPCSRATAEAMQLKLVLPKMRKDTPKRQVARNLGRFRK